MTHDERVRGAVRQASTVALRLVERPWLRAAVEARNPTDATVELEGVRCRVLFSPDVGQRPDVSNRSAWRIRLETGAAHRGEVPFHASDVAGTAAPVRLAEYRCDLDLRVVPPPAAPPGSACNPIRIAPAGYRL